MYLSVWLILVSGILSICQDHTDNHEHNAPHFKYSKEANIHQKNVKAFGPHVLKRSLRPDSPQLVWSETALAVLLISVAPFLLLCLLPDLNKHQRLLKILLAFAAGGLLGDAFLHLIPHAIDDGDSGLGSHDHNHHEHTHIHHDHKRHMVVGLSVVSGIFIFLCVEKLIRLVKVGHTGHSHLVQPQNSNMITNDSKSKNNKKRNIGNETTQKREKKQIKPECSTELRVAGYLNLAADFTHNFTDGLAIGRFYEMPDFLLLLRLVMLLPFLDLFLGASFLVSRNVGIVTTLTVLFHELPHEIGDYAILINSGCSSKEFIVISAMKVHF
ncbi:Metal cation transporter ZIP family [Paragonimus heterotremus]|uniref:Metal cation transporter ZIP family n=1 Tax=Paragonimus heterotremus TaxID=100268 RepID=A0A8J4WCQ0_9TREM|nr:Metal cation transporter ZIP family [Paragonimus heterotremus]